MSISVASRAPRILQHQRQDRRVKCGQHSRRPRQPHDRYTASSAFDLLDRATFLLFRGALPPERGPRGQGRGLSRFVPGKPPLAAQAIFTSDALGTIPYVQQPSTERRHPRDICQGRHLFPDRRCWSACPTLCRTQHWWPLGIASLTSPMVGRRLIFPWLEST